MYMIVARLMWLVLPIFGKAVTNILIRNNVSLVSAYLANMGLSSLCYILWSSYFGNGGLLQSEGGRQLIEFLRSRRIIGPAATVFAYAMILATVISKFVWYGSIILISPLISAFIYWCAKSLGYSTFYLTEAYNSLPEFIKGYFIYLNKEIMYLFHNWFEPVKETSITGFKWIMIWKSVVTVFTYVIAYYDWPLAFVNWLDLYLDPVVAYLENYRLFVWLIGKIGSTYYLLLGLGKIILPNFIQEFINWVFFGGIIGIDWLWNSIDWIRTFFGWK